MSYTEDVVDLMDRHAYGPTCIMLTTPSSMTAVAPVTSTRFELACLTARPTLISGADPVACS